MELTGGQALARQLVTEGITDIFGIPGVQLDFAMDGLTEVRDQLTFRNTRHEQATTYMADGFARSSGQVGVSMVVPGPGVLNALAGLSTAWACSSPVLLLAGQIPLAAIGLGRGLLHEIPDQSGVIAGLTKWSAVALSAAEVPGLVHEAMTQLRSGRPQPVALELPPDVLNAKDEITLVDAAAVPRPLKPDEAEVGRVVELLSKAHHPVICAGWGVQAAGGTSELRRLAQVLGAPVVMSQHGRGSLDDRDPHALTSLAAPEVLRQADVVLAVGTRFVEPDGSAIELPESTDLVVLNADEDLLAREQRAKLRLLSDALLGLRAIADELHPGHTCDWRVTEFEEIRRNCAKQIAEVEPQAGFVRALREAIPEDGILVTELTQVGYLSLVAYPVYEDRTFLTPGYQGTLGYGFPTALGAKVANPGRTVVSITGDGGFGWNLQELATARAHSIGVVTVVFNDNAFGNVRRTQVERFGGRVIGSDLVNPDFSALGAAFGIRTIRAETPSELTAAIASERDEDEPLLIEVPVEPMPTPWHLLHPVARRARIANDAQSETNRQRSSA